MLEAGLQQHLLADTTVASLIGTRIYPVVWPNDPTFPLVTYQLISTVTDNLLSGPLSLATCRIQFDSYAKAPDYAKVKAIAAALRAALEGFTGVLPDGTSVANITLDSSFDLYESTEQCHRVSSDFLVTFTRTA